MDDAIIKLGPFSTSLFIKRGFQKWKTLIDNYYELPRARSALLAMLLTL